MGTANHSVSDQMNDPTAAISIGADATLESLLLATAATDRRAFRALYDRTSRRLYGIAMFMVRQQDAAEDILQDAYVKIWRDASRYDPEKGPALPWLSRVVRNLAIDYLRKNRGTHENIDDVAESLVDLPAPPEDRSALASCIALLSPDHREAISLTYIHGYTHEEMAAKLGLSLGTAKSRVRRGLMQLKALFEAPPPAASSI
jgi:RNA polymerase sigma-70 factor (ECF subfamily)